LEEVAVNPSGMRIVRFYVTRKDSQNEQIEFHIDDTNEHGATIRRTLMCAYENGGFSHLVVDQVVMPETQARFIHMQANVHMLSENLVDGMWCQWTGLCAP
jgi:hypothetical protein